VAAADADPASAIVIVGAGRRSSLGRTSYLEAWWGDMSGAPTCTTFR
jgi:hypothetical protein